MRPIFAAKSSETTAPRRSRWIPLKIKIGAILAEFVDLYKARKELSDTASVVHAQSLPDRLSSSQFAQLRRHQTDTLDLELRKKAFRETDPKATFHGIAYRVLEDLLARDKSIRSVLNIGCNYAYMDWLLARKYPSVRFHGIDVNIDVPEINADLKLPNNAFYSGYALEMIENGQLSADAVYMSSTSTVIRHQELAKYAELISQFAKYYLFSEPIWILPGDEIVNPKSLQPLGSIPALVQRHPLTGNYGYLCWIHNYYEILDKAGFEVIDYRFYRPEFSHLYWCVALGENRNADLWK
jgi:hypothetical protein